ncbi:hypothetical protein DOY81_013897 [Sarcophaga bullata]|nr:hypothetical protein DOY81_013897 [Sarcophaga bullata]
MLFQQFSGINAIVMYSTGRRPLLMLSAGFMCVCTFGVGFYFFKKESDPDFAKAVAWLPVLCCCLYVIMFSFGFVPSAFNAELFSDDIIRISWFFDIWNHQLVSSFSCYQYVSRYKRSYWHWPCLLDI